MWNLRKIQGMNKRKIVAILTRFQGMNKRGKKAEKTKI